MLVKKAHPDPSLHGVGSRYEGVAWWGFFLTNFSLSLQTMLKTLFHIQGRELTK